MKKLHSSKGFSLLEIMIAIAIFGVIMGMMLSILSRSLDFRHRAKIHRQSILLAQVKMNEILTTTDERSDNGEFESHPGFSFKTTITEFPIDLESLMMGEIKESEGSGEKSEVADYYAEHGTDDVATTGLEIKMLHYNVEIIYNEKKQYYLDYYRGLNF